MKAFGSALLIAALAGAITASIVRAQIVFPDGTRQTTAFKAATVPPGAAFAEVVPFVGSDNLIPISPDAIPAGKELVVLQVRFPFIDSVDVFFSLESRLAAPNQAVGPINLTFSNGGGGLIEFPDGTVIVPAGRQLWLQFRSTWFDPYTAGTAAVCVLGYYRDNS